jgi:hypothetical protein
VGGKSKSKGKVQNANGKAEEVFLNEKLLRGASHIVPRGTLFRSF